MVSTSVGGFPISSPRGNQRVFSYCHDGVGIGHLCRTLAICERVGEAFSDASFLLATGTPYVPLFPSVARIDYIKLPALQKITNNNYHSRKEVFPASQVMKCRESLLLNTIQHFEPGVVLVDKAPVGVQGELVPALKWLRKHRPETRLIFGMRDIEDAGAATMEQWSAQGVPSILEECYDEIWVYGSHDVFNVAREYELSRDICKKLMYLGYVSRCSCKHVPVERANENEIIVTVGGGTDGEFLIRTYLEEAASKVSKSGFRSTIVGGPDLPADASNILASMAEHQPNVEWIDFETCMNCRIRDARLVVSMGGYNTLSLIAGNRKPALVIPRTHPRQEQLIRAKLWEKHGVVATLEPDSLSPSALAARIMELLREKQTRTAVSLDLNGLDRVCARFETIWGTERHHATAVPV
ncbi:MAG: glycosyltransferase family protein [Planctomycetota bacterium]|jgi:predicted glycosyltransferase